MNKKTILLLTTLAILHGCAEPLSNLPGDEKNPDSNVSNAPVGNSTNLPARLPGDVYYTGYDGGVNDMSLLITTRRTLVIEDTSVATASLETVTIPTATVDNMIAELKAVEEVSARREQHLRERLSNPSAWRITPKKAGTTYIKATRYDNNGAIRPQSVWYNDELRTLVVTAYTPAQIQTGETRYLNGSPSCASCHTDVTSGAPTHQIGRIMDISDQDAVSWISQGSAGDRFLASHAWSFSSDDEKTATVAYLRKQQTKDVGELARLLFDEALADAKAQNL